MDEYEGFECSDRGEFNVFIVVTQTYVTFA